MKAPKPTFSASSNATTDALPKRQQIDERYKWNLQHIFDSNEDWETELNEIEEGLSKFDSFAGTLGQSAESLFQCLRYQHNLEERFGRLFLYSGLSNDQDTSESLYQDYRGQASALMAKINQRTSFIQPEILALGKRKIDSFLQQHQSLQEFQHLLEDIFRTVAHVLPPEQEQLLALTGELAQGASNIFSMFNNADIQFSSILDENEREVEVTKARHQRFMESKNRRVREDSYRALYGAYHKWTNTLAATLSTAVKRNLFYAKARRYNTALEAALDSENIPVGVYDNVINTINQNLNPLQNYMSQRAKILGLETVRPWDLTVPLVTEVDFNIPYDDAAGILREALAPLGEDYLSAIDKAFEDGWVDVYENRGKRSGAYSWSTYGAHPYILMNYNATLNNLFTLAHELGHALHSYYTHQSQPNHYSHYTIFVAEVASTLNEALLMDYLLKRESGERRRYLINEYIDQIRGTVYNQALFAELERDIHTHAESGQTLTGEYLNGLTASLYNKYLGEHFQIDDLYQINWCRIPHFYYNFYVYKYATGFSAATALSRKILDGDTSAREAYLSFLSRGNSDYSINLLKDAGVNMLSAEPIEATTTLMMNLLKQFSE
ncbi:MAG: oligoendopeptidase F [Calditrichia bacterium]